MNKRGMEISELAKWLLGILVLIAVVTWMAIQRESILGALQRIFG